MAFYNPNNLRVGVAIDDEISCIKKGEFVFYQVNDYNSTWPVSIDIITEFMIDHQRARHAEDSYLIHILDIELAFKNLQVIHAYILSKLLERGKALIKMLEDRKRGSTGSSYSINSITLRDHLKIANEFSGSFPYSSNVWRRDIFSSYKCTAMYAVQSDKDMETKINPDILPLAIKKELINSWYGVKPVTAVGTADLFSSKSQAAEYLKWRLSADAVVELEHNKVSMHEDAEYLQKYPCMKVQFDYAISDENQLEMIEKKEENYMRSFLKNIEYLEVSAKRSILEATTRRKSYAIYYPEMEITDSIADELIFILIDMYNNGPTHKVIFNPEKGTTTVELSGYPATVKCHGDDKFSFSKGYLAACVKASRHGKMNWLSEIKNHRKVHILPKKEESNTLPWEEIPNMKTYPTLEGDDD